MSDPGQFNFNSLQNKLHVNTNQLGLWTYISGSLRELGHASGLAGGEQKKLEQAFTQFENAVKADSCPEMREFKQFLTVKPSETTVLERDDAAVEPSGGEIDDTVDWGEGISVEEKNDSNIFIYSARLQNVFIFF